MGEDTTEVEVPAVVVLQLVLVRSLLDRAWAARREEDEVGLMTSILLADVAVETITKEALAHKRVEFGKQDKLATLLKELEKAFPALAGKSELAAATRLRDARNPVQHSGQVPSARSLELHLRDAESVVELIVRVAFGVEFKALSAAHILRAPDLRDALLAATSALREGNAEVANLYLSAAFDVLGVTVRHWTRRVGGRDARQEMFAGVWIRELVVAMFGPEHSAATETTIERDPDSVEALVASGFPLAQAAQLKKLAVRARMFVRSLRNKDPEPLVGEPPTPRDVERGIALLTQQVARLEAVQPDLFHPRRGPFSRTKSSDEDSSIS